MGAQGQEEITSHSSFEGVESAKRDCLLQAIRCGSLRLLLAKTEIDTVGTALKRNLVSVDRAFDLLDEIGAMPLIDTIVERNHG